MSEPQKVEISFTSYLKLLLIVLGVYLLWLVKDVVIILFVTFVLFQALDPVVKWLSSRGVPRIASVTLIYVFLIVAIIAVLSLILPPLVTQLQLLALNLPMLISKVRPFYNSLPASVNLQQLLINATDQLGGFTGDIVTIASRFFGGVVSVVTVFVLSFYLLIDEKQIDSLIQLAVPSSLNQAVKDLLAKIGGRVGGWVRGQALVSLIMGVATFIALSIIGVPYALTIAVLAAILEMLPILGPIATGIFTVIITLGAGSWGLTIAALIAFVVLLQLEGHFVVPNIMQKVVGLSPVVIIVALLVGSILAGVPGAVLAVPAAACIDVLVDEWPRLRTAFERGRV